MTVDAPCIGALLYLSMCISLTHYGPYGYKHFKRNSCHVSCREYPNIGAHIEFILNEVLLTIRKAHIRWPNTPSNCLEGSE